MKLQKPSVSFPIFDNTEVIKIKEYLVYLLRVNQPYPATVYLLTDYEIIKALFLFFLKQTFCTKL